MKVFKVFKKRWYKKCKSLGDEYLYSQENKDNPKYKVYCFLDTPQLREHITQLHNELKRRKM